MIVLIINFNRLTLPQKMADWCALHGLTPIFVDNHSDYNPLLEYYYSECPYDVYRLKANYGHTVIWNKELNILGQLGIKGRYIVTDPDLGLEGIPDDFMDILNAGLDKYQNKGINKCGFSLEINDLPDSAEGNFIREKVEPRYWRFKLDDMFYKSPIDTTFALYRKEIRHYTHEALRTERPYTAKHIPWYYSDLSILPEDEQYYFRTANDKFSTGKKRLVG